MLCFLLHATCVDGIILLPNDWSQGGLFDVYKLNRQKRHKNENPPVHTASCNLHNQAFSGIFFSDLCRVESTVLHVVCSNEFFQIFPFPKLILCIPSFPEIHFLLYVHPQQIRFPLVVLPQSPITAWRFLASGTNTWLAFNPIVIVLVESFSRKFKERVTWRTRIVSFRNVECKYPN